MKIQLFRKGNGSFATENRIDFCRGGRFMVSVETEEHGYDEVFLRKEAETYLNRKASLYRMKVLRAEGPVTKIPVRVERGESVRVRYIEFPIEILPL